MKVAMATKYKDISTQELQNKLNLLDSNREVLTVKVIKDLDNLKTICLEAKEICIELEERKNVTK